MSLIEQVDTIDPSAKDALFRRLMAVEDLAYLRDSHTIIGFELDLEKSEELSGYAVIAIQKHTILAYRSDLDEARRLVIFPSLMKIEDPAFDLLDLTVKRKRFSDASFLGTLQGEGDLKSQAEDLIRPVEEKTEIKTEEPASVKVKSSQIKHSPSNPSANEPLNESPVEDDIPPQDMELPPDEESFDDVPPMDTPDFNDSDGFDEPDGGFDEMSNPDFNDDSTDFADSETNEPTITSTNESATDQASASASHDTIEPTDIRSKQLYSHAFHQLNDVSNYVILELGVNKDVASNVTNAALNQSKDEKTQIDVAVLLFVKLFNEKRI